MKKLLKIKIMIPTLIILLIGLGIGYYFYSHRIIEDDLPKFEKALSNNKDINQYVTKIIIFKDDDKPVKKIGGYKTVSYIVSGHVDGSFKYLDKSQQVAIMEKIIDVLQKTSLKEDAPAASDFYCGKKNSCNFSEIFLDDTENDKNWVSYVVKNIDTKYLDDLTMNIVSNSNTKNVKFSDEDKALAANKAATSLTIDDKSLTEDGNYEYAKGYVVNNSSDPVTYVKVKAIYLDDNAEVIDTDWTYVNASENLEPGERKSFSIMTPYNSQITQCKLEITDYQ